MDGDSMVTKGLGTEVQDLQHKLKIWHKHLRKTRQEDLQCIRGSLSEISHNFISNIVLNGELGAEFFRDHKDLRIIWEKLPCW